MTSPSSARAASDPLNRLSRFLTTMVFGIGGVVFLAAPLLALSWRQIPFPGFLIEHTLVVNSRNGEGWSGRQAGLAPPLAVTRLGGEPITTSDAFRETLQARAVGDRVSIFVQHPDGETRLYPNIELGVFSTDDLLSLFWLPYAVGLAYFGIGVWVFLARGRDRPGRALAFFCACVAIVAGLLFDILTTHVATLIWMTAVAFMGGALISLAMRFPVEWAIVRRRPATLTLPYLVSGLLAAWMAVAVIAPADPWMYPEARSWAYRYAALACLLFFGVMLYRAPQARDSAVRRQARLVLVGSFVAFTPVVIWFLAPVFNIALEFNSLVMLPVLLIFPLTVAVAITRYRLLEIDNLVNRAIVYAVLTATLAGVFTATIALSQRAFIALTGERSDAAIVITTLIVASAATPLRTRLQSWVDRQFREVPTGALRLFEDRVREHLELQDATQLARRLLTEAVTTLGAEAGAIVGDDGRPFPELIQGPWRGAAALSVPIEDGGEIFGLLMLAPRRNGRRYRQTEAGALAEVAGQVARAMTAARLRSPTPIGHKAGAGSPAG